MITRLGALVKQHREAKGLSQGDLGKMVGVERSYIGHIESGRTKTPSREVLTGLAQTLDVSMPQVLAAAGYLPANKEEENKLPDFHWYINRRFQNDKQVRDTLIQVFEAIESVRREVGQQPRREEERRANGE